jgi:hypothetical protein
VKSPLGVSSPSASEAVGITVAASTETASNDNDFFRTPKNLMAQGYSLILAARECW